MPHIAAAQGTTATLGGTITDATGAVIPNATVNLKNEASGDMRTTVSNGSGVFSFSAVPTGTYDVNIAATGFKGFKQTGVHLDPGDQRTVRDIHMDAGASENVTVTSATDQINTESGEQSSLISAEEIKHLSVEGRDVTELLKILPGFAIARGGGGNVDNQAYDPSQVSPTGALGQYAANGTPINGTALLSDGVDITDPGNFGGAIQNVNYEQVSEVKVQTSSFTADTARGPIVINAVGKSGGDKFHGSLYTYARTYQLNSTDWLANYTGQQKPPDRQVYPGFTIGGPILVPGTGFNRSKKLTFFAGAEEYAQRNVYAYGGASGAVLTALVPTAGMRTGDFSATQLQTYLGSAYQPNVAGTSCSGPDSNICLVPQTGPQGQALTNGNISAFIDPLSKIILNGMPLPNTTSNGTYNWITTNLVANNLWQARGRVDYAASERQKFFMVYSIEKGASGVPQAEYYSPRGNLGGINVPGGGLLSTITSHTVSANLTSILSSSLTNEFYAAGAYFKQNFIPKNLAATQGNPYQGVFKNGSTVQPTLEDYGNDGLPLSRLPDGSYGGIFAVKQIRTAGDNVTKVFGKHTVRAGIYYQYDSNPQVSPFINTNGTVALYYFPETFVDPVKGTVHTTGAVASGNGGNYLANFLEGQIFSYNQTNIQPEPNLYFTNFSGYIQDHWRLTPRLTVDAGIRLEHLTPWQDSHGLGVPIFDPTAYANGTNPQFPGVLWHAIDKSVPLGGLATRAAYVDPRLGFSFDVFGQANTILRGGFGVYRAHDSFNDASAGMGSVLGQRTFYVNGPVLFSSLSSYQNQATIPGGFTPDGNVNAFNRNDDESPRVRTYNLSVDQRLPANMLLEIAYVGNHSDKLLNNGSSQTTVLDDLNALPIGSLFGPQPNTRGFAAGTLYPIFAPANAPTNGSVGGLDQAHIDSYKKYPLYNHVYVAQHNVYANYNGLQVGLTRQAGRAHFSTNYTFSKSLGVLGGYANGYPGNPFNYADDYMEETYDHRHIFNAAYTYELGNVIKNHLIGLATNGWEISGITNFQSGSNIPSTNNSNFSLGGSITVPQGSVATVGANTSTCPLSTTGTPATCSLNISNINILGTQDVNLQPTIVADPKAFTGKHQFVNPNAFGLPTLGTNGAYRYGFLPGPAYFDTDLTLAKRFRITDTTSFQLRAAAFNFINHANSSLSSVIPQSYTLNFNQNVTSTNVNQVLANSRSQYPQFGTVPLKEGRRIMEVALRFDF
jgi:hypothetical protein